MDNNITLCILFIMLFSSTAFCEDFNSWSYTESPKGGFISQIISTDPKAENVVMGISVNFFHSADKPTMHVRTTANVIRSEGIGFRVDSNPPVRFEFSTCTDKSCTAIIWLDELLLKEMFEGEIATAAFFSTKKNQITVPVNLSGFTNAYSKLVNSRQNTTQ